MFCLINDKNMCISPDVLYDDFPNAIKAPDDIIFGDIYDEKTAEWQRIAPRPDPPTIDELRREAYATLTHNSDNSPLIPWAGQTFAVDQATSRWQQYFVELRPEAEELQALIIAAKEYIRSIYPD